jgi:hypothetical protein
MVEKYTPLAMAETVPFETTFTVREVSPAHHAGVEPAG